MAKRLCIPTLVRHTTAQMSQNAFCSGIRTNNYFTHQVAQMQHTKGGVGADRYIESLEVCFEASHLNISQLAGSPASS